jgi:uncharacterized protein (DUF2237 family)
MKQAILALDLVLVLAVHNSCLVLGGTCKGEYKEGPAMGTNASASSGLNVLNATLEVCSTSPRTGFYRNGYCETGPQDHGRHVVCAQVTQAFLAFTRAQGNDLSSPAPRHGFPGLKAGDRWCLCALRWQEANRAGVAPPVVLEATHAKALEYVSLNALMDGPSGPSGRE